jgi:aryl-alcohol dehydrogenase-like predicted oxidoreductase
VSSAAQLLPPGITRLGFGGGDLFGGSSTRESTRLVEAAIEAGIRYFDTARLYGNGSGEGVLGRVLPRIRDQVILTSKAGIIPWDMLVARRIAHKAAKLARAAGGPIGRALVAAPQPSSPRFGAFHRSDLERSVHRSLRELRTDYLDLLLLHECGVAHARRADVIEFLDRLQAQGKIRAFGIATHFAETCQILDAEPRVARVVQFASDALNANVARLPQGRAELVVTHSPMKHLLPRLLEHLARDPAAQQRWTQTTGLAADDRPGIARLLLADALAANVGGIVLFATSRTERIAEAVAARTEPAALDALHREIGHMHSGEAA